MIKREEWKIEIQEILNDLGGEASLSEIYDAIVERQNMDLSSKHWKSRVRDTLEVYSSDSDIFKYEDIFYSVEGIGKGVWGLR